MTCINPPGRGVSKACKILTKAFDSKPFARHVSFVNSLPACFQFRAALRTWKWFAGCEVCEFIERGIFSIQSFTLVYKRGCSASSVSHFTTDYSPALPPSMVGKGSFGERRHHIRKGIISTEGALRRPRTCDNYPIPSHATIHPQSLFNHLNRPRIDLSRPPMNYFVGELL